MSHKIDVVSFVKARKAQNTANVASGDIGSLISAISTLQGQLSDALDDISTLQGQVSALQSHTHNYTDVDQTGATLNKTTGTPN